MDINIIVSAISQIGFPIAAFLLLFWLVKEDLKQLTEAVNNNTKSTDTLCTLIKERTHEHED